MLRIATIAALVALPVVLLAPAATAQPPAPTPQSASDDAQAKKLYELGNLRYEEGRYVEAIEAFEEAYRLSKRPLLLFNLANANERMGNVKAAIRHLEAYREQAPEDEHKTIDRRLDSLRERAAAATEVEPNPVPNPDPVPVPTPAPTVTVVPPAPPPGGGPKEPPAADGTDVAAITGGVMLAIGAATLIVGGALGGLTLAARSDASDGCINGFCTAEGLDARGREKDLALATDIVLGVGGAIALTGLIALVISFATSEDDAEETAMQILPAPLLLPGGGGVTLGASF